MISFLTNFLLQLPRARPSYISQPEYQAETETEEPVTYRPRLYHIPSSTPTSLIYKNSVTPYNITPRPTPSPVLQATTYRPQNLPLTITPRPSLLYTKSLYTTSRPILSVTTPAPFAPSRENLNFETEFQR